MISQVLSDRQRLRRRTQLKRSVYSILGKREHPEEEEEEEEEEAEEKEVEEDEFGGRSRDQHLRDYDEEVFDDDDFYHQVHTVHSATNQVA